MNATRVCATSQMDHYSNNQSPFDAAIGFEISGVWKLRSCVPSIYETVVFEMPPMTILTKPIFVINNVLKFFELLMHYKLRER